MFDVSKEVITASRNYQVSEEKEENKFISFIPLLKILSLVLLIFFVVKFVCWFLVRSRWTKMGVITGKYRKIKQKIGEQRT